MMQALFLDVTQQKSSVSTGAELYQGIANDAADCIYVIERETYCLLYANESVHLFQNDSGGLMEQKCYEAAPWNEGALSFLCYERLPGGSSKP